MKEKIRILHLIHKLGAGGAENGIINIVNRIDQERFQSAICSFAPMAENTQKFRLEPGRCDLFALDKRDGNDPRLPFRLFKILRKFRPHILHTHSWGTLCEGMLAGKIAGIPAIVHGEHGTIQKQARNLPVQRFVWGLADQVLAVSEPHRQSLASTVGFPGERIRVLENGVDTSRFFPCELKDDLKTALVLAPDRPLIGTAGRLVAVKNQAMLLKAMARLAPEFPQATLALAGDGPLHGELGNLAATLGISQQVALLGRRSDIPEFMRALDIFVLPSLSEGMSNTILEAMATGLPVIATNVGGNPELVTPKTGFLVESGDDGELAARLRLLLADRELRLAMGRAGRLRIEHRFSLEAMVERYQDLYLSILRKKTRREET